MREIKYKSFSFKTHQKNWNIQKPNVCQFELTFKCNLHCRHCYSDCYNNPSYISQELNTGKIKIILNKVCDSGVTWLCFTGGDPLARDNFLEIYSYAKLKGFIITIFTNAYSMTEKIADFLKNYPPFVIEITLNAVSKKLYEHIVQREDSYEKMKAGLNIIVERKLPLKIKTQLTEDNFNDRERIREFVGNLGLKFRPSFNLYPRLDRDTAPCGLRISVEDILRLNGRGEDDCLSRTGKTNEPIELNEHNESNDFLFRCAVGGGDGFHVDPYGNMFLCNLIRNPSINLLSETVANGLKKLNPFFKERRFKTTSECRSCSFKNVCLNCPGNAYLETGDAESPIKYYCELARKTSVLCCT